MVLGMVSVLCHVVSLTILLQGEGGGDPAPALMSHLARSILKVGRGVGVGTFYSRLHGRCRSSYKVFSDLLRKQYTKQQNNGP